MTAKQHRIEKRKPSFGDPPGKLLAAASWPEGGTAIVLDDGRVRTYYGPAMEALIAVGPVTVFWMREELALLRKLGDDHRTAPGDITKEIEAALVGVADMHYAVTDLNAEVLALHVAVRDAKYVLRDHMTAAKPRPALSAALRKLDKALVPFGELTAKPKASVGEVTRA